VQGKDDPDDSALRKEFIPNWTSDEFVAFVEKIGEFVDLLWSGEGEARFVERNIRSGKGRGEQEMRERVLELWRRVLDAEQAFWPVVEN
jgi:thiaminase